MSAVLTPQQELEQLVAEQQADDTFYVVRPHGEISLDSPSPSGEGTIGTELVGYDPWDDVDEALDNAELLGRDPWALVDAAIDAHVDPVEVAYGGEIVSFLRPRRGDVLLDPQSIVHGTIAAYRNRGCRCVDCKAANTRHVSEWRARKRAEAEAAA